MTPLTVMALAAACATIALVWHRLFFVHDRPITLLDAVPRVPWLRGDAAAPALLARERQSRPQEVLCRY